MPWDRKRLLGYVETIQLILGVTDKLYILADYLSNTKSMDVFKHNHYLLLLLFFYHF